MNNGCCNATKVAIIQALKRRIADEMNPEVRRGLQIAIYEVTKEAEK